MKALLLCLLLTGCASKCPDCLSLTPAQLGVAVGKGWLHGRDKGFDAGEDAAELKRLKAI